MKDGRRDHGGRRSPKRGRGPRPEERFRTSPGDDSWDDQTRMIGKRAIPRNATPKLANLGRPDGGDPTADGGSAQEHRGHDWSDRDGLLRSARQLNGERGAKEGEGGPKDHTKGIFLGCSAV